MGNGNGMFDAVQWHEGMLLSPQHFQVMDRRNEQLVQYRMSAGAPFSWGVVRCEVDSQLLLGGVFRVRALEAVMPDGLVARYDSTDQPLEIDLAPYEDGMRSGGVRVYLTVPASMPGREVRGENARYESYESGPVVDESTGNAIHVPLLRPRIALAAGGAPSAQYVSLPLAEVVSKQDGLSLSDYMPPSLLVRPGTSVFALSERIVRIVRKKAMIVGDRITSAGRKDASYLLESRLGLAGLLSWLPLAESLLYSGAAHPFSLFLALQGLAGSVSSVGRAVLPPRVEYHHEEAYAAFAKVVGYIARVLDRGVAESYQEHRFALDDETFSLGLSGLDIGEEMLLGVVPRSGQRAEDAERWMRQAIIGASDGFEHFTDRRVLGATRRKVQREGEFVAPANTALFAVNVDPATIDPQGVVQIAGSVQGGAVRPPAAIVLYQPCAADGHSSRPSGAGKRQKTKRPEPTGEV